MKRQARFKRIVELGIVENQMKILVALEWLCRNSVAVAGLVGRSGS